MTCRTCLSRSECESSLAPILGPVAEQIWQCTGVRVSADDGLPSAVCSRCSERLQVAHEFRQLCRRSDERLRRVKIEIKAEPPVAGEIDAAPKLEFDDERDDELPVEVKLEEEQDDDDGEEAEAEEEPKPKRRKRRPKPPEQRKRYACSECEYSSHRKQALEYHSRTHTGERPYACAHCPKRFTQSATLACHVRTVHDQLEGFACDECGKRFKHRKSQAAHRALRHEGAARPAFACDLCGKSLSSKKALAGHLDRHNNVKNYSCETCGSLFVTQGELTSHARTHAADDKRFACHLCEFRTHLKTSLDQHLLRHAGERRHACDACERRFCTLSELASHRRKHSREKSFACPVCDARFAHGRSVKKHARKAHGVNYDGRAGAALGKNRVKAVVVVEPA